MGKSLSPVEKPEYSRGAADHLLASGAYLGPHTKVLARGKSTPAGPCRPSCKPHNGTTGTLEAGYTPSCPLLLQEAAVVAGLYWFSDRESNRTRGGFRFRRCDG